MSIPLDIIIVHTLCTCAKKNKLFIFIFPEKKKQKFCTTASSRQKINGEVFLENNSNWKFFLSLFNFALDSFLFWFCVASWNSESKTSSFFLPLLFSKCLTTGKLTIPCFFFLHERKKMYKKGKDKQTRKKSFFFQVENSLNHDIF